MDFRDYNISIPPGKTSGNIKTYCPHCRNTRHNKRDKSLSVNIAEGVWNCHHCGWTGSLHRDPTASFTAAVRTYKQPPQLNITELPRDVVRWFADVRHISETTLKAMHITTEPYEKNGKQHHWVVFNYLLDGKPVTFKARTADKKFRMFEGGRVIPYNIDAIKDKAECIITEGEMDVLALYEAGYRNAVSAPTGSNRNLSWLDDFIDTHFDDKETIYIAGDTDEAGRKLREELVIRLGADRCKLVTWGDDCKDANDVLIKHGRQDLRQCIDEAADIPQDGIFSEADYHESLLDMWHSGLKQGMTLGFANLDSILSVETKRLMIVTGIPSSGKSEFIDEMCVRLNLIYGLKVGYFSPENMPLHYHGAKLIEKLVGTHMRENEMPRDVFEQAAAHVRDNFFHIMPEVPTVDYILDAARWLVRRRGIKILVIDPYNRIESEQPAGMNETTYISQILDKLTQFSQQFDVLTILMAHPRKVQKDKDTGENAVPTMYDINGSANFYNKADFGLIVHRFKEDTKVLVRVAKVKFKHLGSGGDARFYYEFASGRYYPEDADADRRNYLKVNLLEKPPQKPPQKPYAWAKEQENESSLDWLTDENSYQPPF